MIVWKANLLISTFDFCLILIKKKMNFFIYFQLDELPCSLFWIVIVTSVYPLYLSIFLSL